MEYRIFNENTLVIQYLIRLGVLIVLTLQTYALSKSCNRNGNLWMFAILALMIPIYLNDNEVFKSLDITISHRWNIILYMPVVAIPIISYFTITYYIKPSHKFSLRDLLIFTPVVVDWLMLLPLLINPQITTQWSGWGVYVNISNYVIEPLIILFSFFLWYKALKNLKEHSRDIKLLHSSTEQVDLKWLYGFASCIPILFISHLLRELFPINMLFDIGDCITFGVVLFLSWNITQQRDVFPYEITIDAIKKQHKKEESISKENFAYNEKAKELEQLMKDRQPYLNPNLNLGDLAYLLNIKPKELSQLLASRFSTNFYSYINKYRVEKCKTLLTNKDNAHLSMEGIASMAGFKSKSTFYLRFKEFTGLTPLQYIEYIAKSN